MSSYIRSWSSSRFRAASSSIFCSLSLSRARRYSAASLFTAMGLAGDPVALPMLRAAAADTEYDENVRSFAYVALGRMKVNPLDVSGAMMSGDPARQVWAAGLLENVAKAAETRREMDRRALAMATATAQLQVQKETPIGMAFKEKAHQWLDKEALQGKAVQEGGRPVMKSLDVGTQFQDAMRKGINLSDEQFKDMKTMQNAHSILNGLEQTMTRLFTTNSPSLAAFRAGRLKLQGLLDSNPDVARLKASAGQLYALASAFGAGTGRALSDKDMAIILDMVNLGYLQTRASSEARMNAVRRIVLNSERIAAGVAPLPESPVPALKGTWDRY